MAARLIPSTNINQTLLFHQTDVEFSRLLYYRVLRPGTVVNFDNGETLIVGHCTEEGFPIGEQSWGERFLQRKVVSFAYIN